MRISFYYPHKMREHAMVFYIGYADDPSDEPSHCYWMVPNSDEWVDDQVDYMLANWDILPEHKPQRWAA